MQLIEGEISHIIYKNEVNGYTVARLRSQIKEHIIVGKLYTSAVGQRLRLQGEFEETRYGMQFTFDKYELIYPTTVNGIKKFLGSGLIKGVGPATAKLIVDKFGKDSLEVIEFNPDLLAEIKGISLKKALTINAGIMEVKHVQNIVVFLSQYNISVNLALKIYEIFKEKAIPKIQENPYILVERVDGIGFVTADSIAGKLGIKENSEFRMRAGILHTLKQATERSGHTYLPLENLLKETTKLLNLDETENAELFMQCINILAIDKLITKVHDDNIQAIMLSKYHYYEKSVAEKLALLCFTQKTEKISFNIDSEIKHFEQINKIKFHSEQITAIKTAINNGVCVITGGPGTGKTTIIKCILEILEAQDKKSLLLAPTGRASKRMSLSTGKNASTIHRALAMDFETKNFAHNEQNPLPYNAVIIDEFSMVDIALAYNLLKALSRECKIIMVGDKDQLPSVGAGNVLEDIISSGVAPVASLTQIFRQEENSLIITNAHKINNGEMPIFDNKSKDFFFDERENLVDIKSTIIGMVTTRLPKFLNIKPQVIQVLAPMKVGVCGIENLNMELQQKINPPSVYKPELVIGSTIFRKGDKVMQTNNNYNLSWTKTYSTSQIESGQGVYNGDIGYIIDINRADGETTIEFEDGRVCIYPRTELNQLSLAYAITIHKSQGSEFDVVVIPIIAGSGIILNRNLIYTAVTRAKKMVVLVGEKQNLKRMIGNKFLLKRYTMLNKFLKNSAKKAEILFN